MSLTLARAIVSVIGGCLIAVLWAFAGFVVNIPFDLKEFVVAGMMYASGYFVGSRP